MKKLLLSLLFLITFASISHGGTVAMTTDGNGNFISPSNIKNYYAYGYNVKIKFGAVGNGVTDDTTAIQNGINYIITNHIEGATLYFPPGTYIVGGAIQQSGTANAQLIIPPTQDWPSSSTTIKFLGPIFQAQSMYVVSSGGTNDGSAIIKSTITGPGGQAALLSTYRSDTPENFNQVTVDIENLTFQLKPDPQMIGLNLRKTAAVHLKGVRVWTGLAPTDIVQPTGTTSVAITTPTNNNGAFTHLENCSVAGFYTGYEFSEHSEGSGNTAWACYRAMTFPFGFHSSWLGRFGSYHCPHGIVVTGISRFIIEQFNIEHLASTWQATIDDISDVNSIGAGNVTYAVVLGFVGVSHTWSALGTNIYNKEIGSPTFVRGQ